MTNLIQQLKDIVNNIRLKKPLILNLTNYVTQDFIANTLLALGCAPIMCEDNHEITELIEMAHAININIGSINPKFMARVRQAITTARLKGKFIALDPVGSGASKIRTKLARELMPLVDVIRGNSSEIISIYDSSQKSLGVESSTSVIDAWYSATSLAKKYHKTIVVTGSCDLIVNQKSQVIELNFGTKLMQFVTGMGCSLTAVIASFASVELDYFKASHLAVIYFTLLSSLSKYFIYELTTIHIEPNNVVNKYYSTFILTMLYHNF